MEPLSALYRPSDANSKEHGLKPTPLTDWYVDDDSQSSTLTALKSSFDAKGGTFAVPRDGLYSVVVEIIPTDGGANCSDALQRRKEVAYMIRVEETAFEGDDDGEEIEFLDVGPLRFGEVMHLKAQTLIAVYAQPGRARRESVRLKVDLIQRKRKRAPRPELSKKELKKLRKKRRKEGKDESESDSGSSWSFSSDESVDEDEETQKRAAKRARTEE